MMTKNTDKKIGVGGDGCCCPECGCELEVSPDGKILAKESADSEDLMSPEKAPVNPFPPTDHGSVDEEDMD